MKNSKNNVLKYLGSAMAVGGTVMLGSGLMAEHSSAKKKVRKTADKAIDTIENLITGVQNIFD